MRDKFITSIVVDPHWETADTDTENNNFPRRITSSRTEVFKMDHEKMGRNLMKDVLDGEKEKAEEEDKEKSEENAETPDDIPDKNQSTDL